MICRKSSFGVKQGGSPNNLREGPCPGWLSAPDICAGTNYLVDRTRTLCDERAPSGVVYPSPPPPQGLISPLSKAPARREEGSYGLSPSPADWAWAARTACTSICLVAPRPDLKARLLGVLTEPNHPSSILIDRPHLAPLHLLAPIRGSRGW